MSIQANNGIVTDRQLLKQPSYDVALDQLNNPNILDTIAAMLSHLKRLKAQGIAAIQIGIPLRIICISNGKDVLTIINPKVEKLWGISTTQVEGCLSLPRLDAGYREINIKYRQFRVSRKAKVRISFIAINGDTVTKTFKGNMARVIQHELDHLEGRTIADIGQEV